MAPTTPAMSGPPRKRQKLTTTACEPCRSRKIRCNGAKPNCEACSKRAQQCIYQTTPDVESANAYVDSLVNRVSQLEQELNNARATILRLSTGPAIAAPLPQHLNIDPRLLPENDVSSAEPGSVDAMGGDAGAEHHSSDGQTFYGSSSALGFTRQMYGAILQKDTAPAAPEVTGAPSSVQQLPALPAFTEAYVAPENFSLLPRELADRLMDLYWDRVHVLYPFLHKASFSQAYEDLWKPSSEHRPRYRPGLGLGASKASGPSSVLFHCAFNAALALGMQFSDLALNERERLSSACQAKSKDLLRLDLFDDGNIALVQTLLLLTQYFQSTNGPNKCWTSIGLACRLAQGLGLHIEEDRFEQQFSVTDREIRRRVWHGCVTMDIIVSMTLGRPALLIGSKARSPPAPIDGDDEYQLLNTHGNPLSSIDFFTETVKLYRIIGRILLNIYKDNDEHHEKPDPAEEDRKDDVLLGFQDELAQFARGLPEGLKWQSSSWQLRHETTGILARQSHVLHVRVLHARILLFRPAFLQYCRLHQGKDGVQLPALDPEAAEDAISFPLTCVQTALELIKYVKEYSATEATGAWWYNVFYTRSAAMVFLLSAVCPSIHVRTGDRAWQSAWADCVEILTTNLPQYALVKACLTTLKALYRNVVRQGTELGLLDLSEVGNTDDMLYTQTQAQGGNEQDAVGQKESLVRDAQDLPMPAMDASQDLLDSMFDPFAFVEKDLFTDLGFDFTQSLQHRATGLTLGTGQQGTAPAAVTLAPAPEIEIRDIVIAKADDDVATLKAASKKADEVLGEG
ncbi:hypothetical protein BU25DRAFT_450824 [Macroventuria anomochaeta]|uniref:Uncharacterized protein n=1 Tax=Macroventuria anomochaeta TaxID=301207 RepID=A0ACB6RQQ2_9PLEO|nr:uncharacterized protein BU25DRAFT_450824 [Macroventuria anomochaeta]KAF2624138.1 hypothetical protein BU25DRAFT_450824 [Macroventuria anomochaeta]